MTKSGNFEKSRLPDFQPMTAIFVLLALRRVREVCAMNWTFFLHIHPDVAAPMGIGKTCCARLYNYCAIDLFM